jgi:hypothetical protein
VIAIHFHQIDGGQGIDAVIIDVSQETETERLFW